MIIFKKDENGKLHQMDTTLQEIKSSNKHVSVNLIQCYVMFTDAEEEEFSRAQQEALDKSLSEDKIRAEAKLVAKAKQEKEIIKSLELKNAQQDAEQAKNNALMLALKQIEELNKKVEALTSEKQPL